MRLSRRNFIHTAATVLAAPSLLSRAAWAGDDAISLGSLHDLSGPLAASGIPMAYAMQLAVDEVNAGGGLLGRPLKIVQYDTQSSIQLYAQYAQQLSLKDKVSVIHGGITSASREAVRPLAGRYKTLYFYNVLYEGGVCDRNTFCTGTTPAQTVEKLVPAAMKMSGKKVYIVAADYNYGQITAKWMKKFVQENGGEVINADFFPLDVTNFGPAISKIQAAKPDLLLSALVGGNHIAFYRQWTAVGMKNEIPIASTIFGIFNEAATLDPAESENILGAFGYFEELTTPASLSFVEKIKKSHPDSPYISELVAATYEAVHLWAEGIRKAGTLDRMAVVEALESGVTFDGPTGKVALDRTTHHTTRNAFLAQVKDRKWKVQESFLSVPPADTAMVCNLSERPNDSKQYVIEL